MIRFRNFYDPQHLVGRTCGLRGSEVAGSPPVNANRGVPGEAAPRRPLAAKDRKATRIAAGSGVPPHLGGKATDQRGEFRLGDELGGLCRSEPLAAALALLLPLAGNVADLERVDH